MTFRALPSGHAWTVVPGHECAFPGVYRGFMSSGTVSSTVVWLRDDLRLDDNPALTEAVALGNPLTVVYMLDEDSDGVRPLGGAAKWWLHHSLAALAASLEAAGSRLLLRRGPAAEVIQELAEETAATSLLWNRRYGEPERTIDARREGAGPRTTASAPPASRPISCLSRGRCAPAREGRTKSSLRSGVRVSTRRSRGFPLMPRSGCRRPPGGPAANCPTATRWRPGGCFPAAPDWSAGLARTWNPGEAGAHRPP